MVETQHAASLRRHLGNLTCLRHQRFIRIWATIAEELPSFTNFRDHVQIKIGHDHLVFVAAGLRHDLAAWIAEVALAIKLADSPGLFDSDTIYCTDEIAVGDSVRRLFEFP